MLPWTKVNEREAQNRRVLKESRDFVKALKPWTLLTDEEKIILEQRQVYDDFKKRLV